LLILGLACVMHCIFVFAATHDCIPDILSVLLHIFYEILISLADDRYTIRILPRTLVTW